MSRACCAKVTAREIAEVANQVGAYDGHPAQDALSLIGQHNRLDTAFSILQTGLGGIELIGEHQR